MTTTAIKTKSTSTIGKALIMGALIILIGLGSYFRLTNLDYNFWENDANGMQVISGVEANVMRAELTNKVETFGNLLQKYQSRTPQGSLDALMHVLLTCHIPHAPAYYLMLYYWCGWLGSSTGTIRLFSAILSLIQFPAMYWLAMELFASPVAALLSVCLLAISPFQLMYSGEVAEYSLISAFVCFSGAALLRALRTQRRLDWLLYTIVIAASLFVSVNFVSLLATHALVVLTEECPKKQGDSFFFSRNFLLYICASILAVILFLPFICAIIEHWGSIGSMDWVKQKVPIIQLMSGWTDALVSPFWHLGSIKIPTKFKLIMSLLTLAAIYHAYFNCQGKTWKLLMFSALPFLVLAIPDLVSGGFRSTMTQYMMPVPIALTLMIAFMFYRYLASEKLANIRRPVMIALLIALFGLEIGADWVLHSEKSRHPQILSVEAVAAVIAKDPGCLIISEEQDMNIHQLLCLSRAVKPNTRLLWLDNPDEINLPPHTDHFYLYNPPQPLVDLLITYDYKFHPVDNLWYLLRVEVPR